MESRISMSQRERDVLKVMSAVLRGERTQAETARLLRKSERQVRRLQRRLEAEGDVGVVHRLKRASVESAIEPRVAYKGLGALPGGTRRLWANACQ